MILIPGAFGSRLRDRVSGEEIWQGPWWRLLLSSYPELALEIDPLTHAPRPSRLEAAGIAEQGLQRYFVAQLERGRRVAWMLSVAEPVSPIRYVLFGGGCHRRQRGYW